MRCYRNSVFNMPCYMADKSLRFSLEVVQRRVAYQVKTKLSREASATKVMQPLGLDSFAEMIILLFKIINNLIDIPPGLFHSSNTRNRRHDIRLQQLIAKQNSRDKITTNSSSYLTQWNTGTDCLPIIILELNFKDIDTFRTVLSTQHLIDNFSD